MTQSRQRFLTLLRRDVLELESAELDFGIYRVKHHLQIALPATPTT